MYVEEGFYSKPSCDLSRVGEATLLDQVSTRAMVLLPPVCIAHPPPCSVFTTLASGAYMLGTQLNALLTRDQDPLGAFRS